MTDEKTPHPRTDVEREPTGDRVSAPEPAGTRKTEPGAVAEAAEQVEAQDAEIERKRGVHDAGPDGGTSPASVEQTLEEP